MIMKSFTSYLALPPINIRRDCGDAIQVSFSIVNIRNLAFSAEDLHNILNCSLFNCMQVDTTKILKEETDEIANRMTKALRLIFDELNLEVHITFSSQQLPLYTEHQTLGINSCLKITTESLVTLPSNILGVLDSNSLEDICKYLVVEHAEEIDCSDWFMFRNRKTNCTK